MFIVSFAFGFIALASAAHFTDKKWIWLASGIGAFILTAIATHFKITALMIIIYALYLLMLLYLLIERLLRKRR